MDAHARLRNCTAFLLDMDGTLVVDDKVVPGALDFLRALDRKGFPYLLLTNNSSARGEDYRVRMERIGFSLSREQIFTSGDATALHLLTATSHRSAYLVGTPALEAEFRAAGIDLDTPDPDCVVVAFDKTLTYAKLERACTLLFQGKPYFATHPDKTCITTRGLIPDIAAIIAACEAVTGRTPHIIGKPFPEIVNTALGKLSARAATTAMVGDQLDTDMTMARTSGLCGVLVMSGETTPQKLDAWPVEHRPTLVAANVAEVARWIA